MAINAGEIREAFMGMNLTGDDERGLLRAFGVILACNSVDYLIGREMDFTHALGPKATKMVDNVLIDAAQWCCNATFGGIMASEEWAQLIEPNIENTPDRLAGLVAVANCLGWGKIVSTELDEDQQELTMRVDHSYYVDAWQRDDGKADRPICFMWTGVAAGFLDLLYADKVHAFEATELKCGAMGDDCCEFHAKRVTKAFGYL